MPNDPAQLTLSLQSLRPSSRMPVLFVGHGSPMNAIEDNAWRRGWQAVGREFGTAWQRPQLILCVSAHWLTHGWWLTAMERPRTIHDFGAFPAELFAQQYPVAGAPVAAAEIAQALADVPVGLDRGEWGLDHGAWSVLQPMFPEADVPALQLSMDFGRPPADHFALGQRLRGLRDWGVLLVASGNTVHNLRVARRGLPADQAYDFTVEFDRRVAACVSGGRLDALAGFQDWDDLALQAHPSHEHYLPLLYAAGAADAGEPYRFFNEGYQSGSIAMRSVLWGTPQA